MVDGATSEWIQIVSGVPQGSLLESLLFIIYTSEMFELVKNRLYAYADDSTSLVVVRKPDGRPAVAAFLNRVYARIQEWCNHWFMMLNPNKLRILWLVDPGLWTLWVVTWSSLGIPFELVPTLIFRAWSLTAGLPLKTMCAVLSLLSLEELVFWGWWSVSLWIPLRCFVATLHMYSQSLSIFFRCGGLLLNVIFSFSSARCIRDGFLVVMLSTSCCWTVYVDNVNSNSIHCLFSELPSVSVRVRQTRAATAARKARLQVLVRLRKKFINNFVFPTWACAAGFNNNNNLHFTTTHHSLLPSTLTLRHSIRTFQIDTSILHTCPPHWHFTTPCVISTFTLHQSIRALHINTSILHESIVPSTLTLHYSVRAIHIDIHLCWFISKSWGIIGREVSVSWKSVNSLLISGKITGSWKSVNAGLINRKISVSSKSVTSILINMKISVS